MNIAKPLFIALGFISLGLGILGAFLPILPTTPFCLVAAYFFSKGSPRLYKWLLALPKIGPQIQEWNEHGMIRPKIKLVAVVSLLAVMFLLNWRGVVLWGRAPACLIMIVVMIFVVSRPEKKRDYSNK